MKVSKTICAIDPGVTAVGLAFGKFHFEYDETKFETTEQKKDEIPNLRSITKWTETQIAKNTIEWHFCATINLVTLTKACEQKNRLMSQKNHCKLHHWNQMADRVMHLIQEFPFIQSSDILIVEDQNVTGKTDVQNLLLALISPREKFVFTNATHRNAVYELNKMDRMIRKEKMVKEVLNWMNPLCLIQEFKSNADFLKMEDEVMKPEHTNLREWSSPQMKSEDFTKLVEECHDRFDALLLIVLHIMETEWTPIKQEIEKIITKFAFINFDFNDYLFNARLKIK